MSRQIGFGGAALFCLIVSYVWYIHENISCVRLCEDACTHASSRMEVRSQCEPLPLSPHLTLEVGTHVESADRLSKTSWPKCSREPFASTSPALRSQAKSLHPTVPRMFTSQLRSSCLHSWAFTYWSIFWSCERVLYTLWIYVAVTDLTKKLADQ